MTARQEKWQMCRLKRTTVANLRALAARWSKLADSDSRYPTPEYQEQLSLEEIVSELLRRDQEHRRRARRNK